MVWFGFYNCLKFDIVNADVSFYKRRNNLEMEVKLNKGQHPFSNEVSLNMGADFQLIPSEDTHKQTKNIHPYMQSKAHSTLNSSVPSDFHLFGFIKDDNGQEMFLRFHLDMKKN